MKLYEPTAGEVLYRGENIFSYNKEQEKKFRKNAQMIFQNPHSSLNPRMTVKDIVGNGMKIHGLADSKDLEQKIEALLKLSLIHIFPAYVFDHPSRHADGGCGPPGAGI